MLDGLSKSDLARLPMVNPKTGAVLAGWRWLERGGWSLFVFGGRPRRHVWVRMLFKRDRLMAATSCRDSCEDAVLECDLHGQMQAEGGSCTEAYMPGLDWSSTAALFRLSTPETVWRMRPNLNPTHIKRKAREGREELWRALHEYRTWVRHCHRARRVTGGRQPAPYITMVATQEAIDRNKHLIHDSHKGRLPAGLSW